MADATNTGPSRGPSREPGGEAGGGPGREPVHEWHAIASGVELHVMRWEPQAERSPTRRPWMLTHGLASNARLWDGVARRLAAAGHLVVTVDQRGHGQSSKPDDGYDVPTCADDLALLIDLLELDRPAVAGQSWGGNVVLELGRRHAGAVDQIACVDGGIIDLAETFSTWDECAAALAPPRLAGTPLSTMREWIERFAADWPDEGRAATLANFEVRDDGTIAPWLTYERHMTVLRGLWEHRPSAAYTEVDVPTLLIPADTGEVSWTSSKHVAVDTAIAALPVGRAHWFSPAHHDVHAQQPQAVAALLHAATTDPDFYRSPTETFPTEPFPTEPFPTEPFPTETFPTEPFPTETLPTEPLPTEPLPTEPLPTDSSEIR